MADVGIGFLAHTGWAAAVTVAAVDGALVPDVVDRRRIDISDASVPGQAYHAAAGLDFAAAERLVRTATEAAGKAARRSLEAMVSDLAADGHKVVGTGIVLANGHVPDALERILASHTLLHAAEGELFREALMEASAGCGLPVAAARDRDLLDEAATVIGREADQIEQGIEGLGRVIGPPWAKDQRKAAVAGWIALVSARAG